MDKGTARTTSRQRVYDHLREVVLTDPSRAGTFLNEVDVATDVGVSRTPVREAFLLLAADGLVEMIPQRGAFIPPMRPRDLAELFEVRGLIESHAAQVVVQAGTSPCVEMRAVWERQRALQDSNQEATRIFIEIDQDFHRILIEAAGNELMAQWYATLRTRQICAGVAAVADPFRRAVVVAEHGRILEALEQSDVDGAQAAVLAHLRNTSAVLRASL